MCPSRILSDNPEIDTVLRWWVGSSTWDGMSGRPAGPPEWPRPGGMLRQPAKLVAAVELLSAELRYVRSAREPQDKGALARKASRRGRK